MPENNLLQFLQFGMTVEEGGGGGGGGARGRGVVAASRTAFSAGLWAPPTCWTVCLASGPHQLALKAPHDAGELRAAFYLCPRAGVGAGEGVREVLVEGPHAVLHQKLIRVVETDGQGKVSFNGAMLEGRGEGREREGRGEGGGGRGRERRGRMEHTH